MNERIYHNKELLISSIDKKVIDLLVDKLLSSALSLEDIKCDGENTLTKLIDPQNKFHSESHSLSSQDDEEILHLKRLLVTMKQHYEKMLNASQAQLGVEQQQRLALEKEIGVLKEEHHVASRIQQEEIDALSIQLSSVKELLKNTREELKGVKRPDEGSPYVRESSEEALLEMEMLREEADRALKKAQELEVELASTRAKAEEKITFLQGVIDQQNLEGSEAADSSNILSHLKREIEMISHILVQGAQESKTLEKKYVEVLNEKTELTHHCKQLQHQIDHQSANLSSFQVQLHKYEAEKNQHEAIVFEKDNALKQFSAQVDDLQTHLSQYQKHCREKDCLQDKYDELKEEYIQLVENYEETTQLRLKAEQAVLDLGSRIKEQEALILQKEETLLLHSQEKELLSAEREQLKSGQEESENKLKVAQQHLAKKVKESTLLNEKVLDLQNQLHEAYQMVESQKNQLNHLQAAVDLYQKQEEKLQDQLHQVLKGTESQVAKWEEKYFHMYSKWQESENKSRELKKYEEKCLLMQNQMQSLLGNFMSTSSLIPANSLFSPSGDVENALNRQMTGTENILIEESPQHPSHPPVLPSEERYDLFGMRQPVGDKFKNSAPS
jgi:chromosome segregation ATPase